MNTLPCASFVLLFTLVTAFASPGPASTGSSVSKPVASSDEQRAALLVGELGCLACHVAPDVAGRDSSWRPGPDLHDIGARRTPKALRDFLANPSTHRPGTRMPMVLSGDADERHGTASDLAHYLASFGGPSLAGDEELRYEEVEAGRQLYHSVGCVACHVPLEEAWALERPLWSYEDALTPAPEPAQLGYVAEESDDPLGRSVPLGPLVGTRTRAELARFLEDPLATRPQGRMPDLHLTPKEATELASYLFFEDALATLGEGGVVPAPARGLDYAYVEGRIPDDGAGLAELPATRRGSIDDLSVLPEHRDEEFAFRYTGFLEITEPGTYGFHTTSDDGSWLWIDGREIVSNGGPHGMVSASGELYLEAGKHSLRVHFFERSGDEGLIVEWTPPGGEREVIPPARLSHEGLRIVHEAEAVELDPQAIERGSRAFSVNRCFACHSGPSGQFTHQMPLWMNLKATEGACYESHSERGRPRYTLSAADRALLAELVAGSEGEAGPKRKEAGDLALELERMRCSACHRGAGGSGPDPDRLSYFQVDTRAELGDEGRIPPSLTGVGAKLRPEWLDTVLREGGGVRPYMRTRMPRFGDENVHALSTLLREASEFDDDWEPETSRERIVNGRKLMGTDGLGCIQCHDFAGHASLGVPAVDLATVAERVQPAWFRRLLMDPGAINMNTRMPSFWLDDRSPVRDIYGGDPEAQTAAMWAYLQLGDGMPLPVGLLAEEGAYELVVEDKAVLCGVFFDDVSPRTLVVGHPELVHYAYDVQNARLAKAWRGRFFNAEGTWHGRAGALEDAPSEDALEFVSGPAIATVDPTSSVPWPTDASGLAQRILGRRFDLERRPRFRFEVLGVEIEEAIVPSSDLSGLRRTFRVGEQPQDGVGLTLRLARAVEIHADEGGWLVPTSGARFLVRGAQAGVREADGRDELLVLLPAGGEFEVEVSW